MKVRSKSNLCSKIRRFSEETDCNLNLLKNVVAGYVHQYLCLVPQERKFCNAISSLILFESAGWIADFSALKAARAFEAIEKYASNLINQPWRKEFREIKVRTMKITKKFREIDLFHFTSFLIFCPTIDL